jgi:hypothetical protein
MDRKTDLKNFTISPDAGKNVKDTKMVNPGAGKDSPESKEQNVTKEYKTSGRGFSGPFGGENE